MTDCASSPHPPLLSSHNTIPCVLRTPICAPGPWSMDPLVHGGTIYSLGRRTAPPASLHLVILLCSVFCLCLTILTPYHFSNQARQGREEINLGLQLPGLFGVRRGKQSETLFVSQIFYTLSLCLMVSYVGLRMRIPPSRLLRQLRCFKFLYKCQIVCDQSVSVTSVGEP